MAPPKLHATDDEAAPPPAEQDVEDGLLASPQQTVSLSRPSTAVRLPTRTPTARAASRTLSATGKSLLPPTERRSYQDRTWPRSMRREDNNKDGWHLVSDSPSVGRQGRQFTVANVGNNGRIYLRPTARPAHSRYPQSSLVFPVTPPATGGHDVSSDPDESMVGNKAAQDVKNIQPVAPSQWTPTPSASPLAGNHQYFPDAAGPADWPMRRRRALSDSTVHDLTAAHEQEKDLFKVVISKPGDEKRPRTMEDFTTAPLLNISIPSWRIGTPRFTLRGTPVFRGSSYAPTEDFRSSGLSVPNQRSHMSLLRRDANSTLSLKHLEPSLAMVPSAQVAGSGPVLADSSSPQNLPATAAAQWIDAAIFTDLTFKPACDSRSIIRYSPTGAVLAATPPRLVAEITSPNFLDYELVSHFFLTFRAFLSPDELLRMLVARLRWALSRTDQVGMIVRVRTFVAIRHWILNYFVDDFVLDYDLRVTFCTLLNEFVDEVSQDASFRKVQLKILAELKKCWRRMCAQHWDGPEFDDSLGPEAPITPGGIAGNRDAQLDPTYWQLQGMEPPSIDALVPPPRSWIESTSVYADASRAAPIGDFIILGNRPATPDRGHTMSGGTMNGGMNGGATNGGTGGGGGTSISPSSPASVDAFSCSFPSKSSRKYKPNTVGAMNAHPVPSQLASHDVNKSVTVSKTRADKSGRNTASAHKRNNSISDSMRERDSGSKDSPREWVMTLPYAGSLVRGNLLPPGQAYVECEPYDNRQTTVFHSDSRSASKDRTEPGNSVRKLLGSVRRALRNRGHGGPTSHSDLIALSSAGPSATMTNRLGAATKDGHLQHNARPPVRIDVLGAEVAEDFKKAIREEQEAVESEWYEPGMPARSVPPFGGHTNYSAAHMDSSTFDSLPQNAKPRAASDMAITVGSKSIVIVDDTLAAGVSMARQREAAAAAASHALAEALSDANVQNCAHPTPPNTPPATIVDDGVSRPCSPLVEGRISQDVNADDGLPPFVPDLTSLQGQTDTEVTDDASRCSFRGRLRHARVSGGTFRASRGRGVETHQSLNSMVHKQFSSPSTTFGRPGTIRSFDATTASTCSVANQENVEVPVPSPLRVLRRRPGGDLRAAANVDDSDRISLARSQSLGSLATYTDSIRSSYLLNTRPNSANYSPAGARDNVFSLGNLTKRPVNSRLSLIDTPGSKPALRTSFEKEAQKLAQIPDDEDDDGGIESALLKLEGKYDKKSLKLSRLRREEEQAARDAEDASREVQGQEANNDAVPLDQAAKDDELPTPGHKETPGHNEKTERRAKQVNSFLSEKSEESYCSIPLLSRGFSHAGRRKKKLVSLEWKDQSLLQDADHEDAGGGASEQHQAQHLSFDMVHKTDSMERMVGGATVPLEQAQEESFLEDQSLQLEDQSLQLEDQSLQLEDQSLRGSHDAVSEPSHHSAESDDVDDGDAFFSKYQSPGYSRPRTLSNATAPRISKATRILSEAPPIDRNGSKSRGHKPLPPTPILTPVTLPNTAPASPGGAAEAAAETVPARKFSVHLPFILAFDSDILAQQFTLIEKDALNEVDWKELIDMKWKNAASSDCRSWVHFLRNSDAQGVEVVIARFNLMVKWAISEIVLTQNMQERARCIIKMIHVASHCRRYRNFATLAQLTLALSSSDVSRLKETWKLVPAHDAATVKNLEALMTPTRNFIALRQEMETGSDSGCIPFIGVYTQDLLFNAQRPCILPESSDAASLVNFERCRRTAIVVKTLLRLIEASTRYAFIPVDGITERCLWVGALSDVEIRRHCDSLEQPRP